MTRACARTCAQRVDDLAPNMGLWWYFFAEIFDHFRPFFLFVFHAQSLLLLVPLTVRLWRRPLVLAAIACMLVALFKVRCKQPRAQHVHAR
jgi:phosphatidylinositol glycan class U